MYAQPKPWIPPPHIQSKPPVLFSPPRAVKSIPATSRFATPGSSQATPPRSYFAFPPSPAAVPPSFPDPSLMAAHQKEEMDRQREKELDEAHAARLRREVEMRAARIRLEEAEAQKGEIDWVRSGGLLRDADGNRDYARTNAIREEIRVSDLERVLVERWATYERRWSDLIAKTGRDREKAKDNFLIAGLKVRGSTVTKKERVRSSLLRWHPDKLTSVLARVVDADVEAVRQGINVVVSSLHQLNSNVH
ncbi:hypothetical protein C8J57DRAFT_238301 [Mycena rebaudengoi]|nr:hypothetical protein C8J57DRAFT_238301 [Mycena rebaudengoi]